MKVCSQLHAPAAFTLGEEPKHTLNRRFDGSQGQSRPLAEQKKLLPLLGYKRRSIVAVLTELSRSIINKIFL